MREYDRRRSGGVLILKREKGRLTEKQCEGFRRFTGKNRKGEDEKVLANLQRRKNNFTYTFLEDTRAVPRLFRNVTVTFRFKALSATAKTSFLIAEKNFVRENNEEVSVERTKLKSDTN